MLFASGSAGRGSMMRRGWQLARLDEAQIARIMQRASRYGINEIQLSHGIMMYIDAINESDRVRQVVNGIVARAHAEGAGPQIRVFVWAHELNSPPGKTDVCLNPEGGGRAFLQARQDAYRRALRACPGVDGVVLMFGSSRLEPWDTTCKCEWCASHGPAEKAKVIIEQIRSVVKGEFGKELMVRTFIHSPDQLRWIGEAVRETDGITVMSKCVPQDWEPYYPHEDLIGKVGQKEQIVEFDLAGEYWGRGVIPFCQPDELQFRLQYDRDQGAVGGMARIDDIFGTPNEVNVFAFSRLMQNPDESVDEIWREWVKERYGLAAGSRASEAVISSLRRTFDIGRKMYYVKGFWVFAKSSEVPEVGRFPQMLRGRSIALYDRAWQGVESELLNPTEQTLEEIAQEKCEAIWLSDQSAADLERAKERLRPEDYQDLRRRLKLQRQCTEIWRWAADAIFRYQLYKQKPSDGQRALVEGALRELESLAGQMESEYGADISPGSPRRIRELIADIRSEFGKSQEAAEHRAPLLRQIEVQNLGSRSAAITWQSDVACDSQVEYGAAIPGYGFETAANKRMTKQHRMTLTGLQPATRYYFRVKSKAADGQLMVSGDFRFRTAGTAARAQDLPQQ